MILVTRGLREAGGGGRKERGSRGVSLFLNGSGEGETEGRDSRQVGRMFSLRRWEAGNSEPGGKICPGQKERCFCQGSRGKGRGQATV